MHRRILSLPSSKASFRVAYFSLRCCKLGDGRKITKRAGNGWSNTRICRCRCCRFFGRRGGKAHHSDGNADRAKEEGYEGTKIYDTALRSVSLFHIELRIGKPRKDGRIRENSFARSTSGKSLEARPVFRKTGRMLDNFETRENSYLQVRLGPRSKRNAAFGSSPNAALSSICFVSR